MALLQKLLLCAGIVALLATARPAAGQAFDVRTAVPPDSLHGAAAAALRVGQPDSLRQRFDEQRAMLRLKAFTRRKTIAGRAASALFTFREAAQEQAGLDAALLDRQFDRHVFKVVRRISIRTLDAFGYSLTDTLRQPQGFVAAGGNALHIKTGRRRIRQVLLFRVGSVLEPQALAESERLLRQTPEILDARVLVNERTATADSVDIEVRTVDVFSISAGWEARTPTVGQVTFGDDNFLGQGHQLANAYDYGRTFDQPGAQPWAYEGSYTVPFRHFVQAQARYLNQYLYQRAGVSVQRDFYSPSARYAGAISFDRNDRQYLQPGPAPEAPPRLLAQRYYVADAWVGRALRLRSYDLGYENPGRLIVAARLYATHFAERAYPTDLNTNLLLGTVGYSVRRYYKDRYLFGFGRTEDVPTGTLLALTAGYDQNSVQPHRYVALRLAGAGYSPRLGYIYGGVSFGTFQRPAQPSVWEQGLLTVENTYFTRLYRLGNYQLRHFLSSRATVGFNRRPGETLQGISNDQGIRGYSPVLPVRATSRYVLSYETTVFTPLSLLGFRLAGIVFADAAWYTERTGGGTPFGNAPYSAFGVGLRFRNEFTALRTFQILLGYYPRGLASPNGFKAYETSRSSINFADFGLGAPGIGGYL